MTATITDVRETDDGDYRCASGPLEIIHKLVAYKLNAVNIQPAGCATGNVGGTFNITCTADSKPAASFNWTKQGDSSFTATGATLRFSNLNVDDSGTYQCTAYHDYDSSTATVQLIVINEDGNYFGSGVITGGAVGCFVGGLLVGGAAVSLFLRFRTAKNGGGKKDARDAADRQHENITHPDQMESLQRPEIGSDDYDYEVPMETIQPPQPIDDYQELRPAIYQSLQH
ncbi:uncharacterized protein LOC144862792 [Branchiostoma floridae x Branchiostoma japonicum]